MAADKGSLEPSSSSAMTSSESQAEAGARASPESYSVEGDPSGEDTLEPSVWVNSLLINMNLKSPRSPRSD